MKPTLNKQPEEDLTQLCRDGDDVLGLTLLFPVLPSGGPAVGPASEFQKILFFYMSLIFCISFWVIFLLNKRYSIKANL